VSNNLATSVIGERNFDGIDGRISSVSGIRGGSRGALDLLRRFLAQHAAVGSRDLQMGLYKNFREDLIAKGVDTKSAERVAAPWANRYAGALPQEAMSDTARKVANMMLFSRSFTLGNLGVVKDMINGLPRDVRAQIARDLDNTMNPKGAAHIKSDVELFTHRPLAREPLFDFDWIGRGREPATEVLQIFPAAGIKDVRPVDRREAQPREQDGLAFTVGIAGHGICLCDFGIDHAGSVASAVGKIASIWAPT
jgi:hypothetical protein